MKTALEGRVSYAVVIADYFVLSAVGAG